MREKISRFLESHQKQIIEVGTYGIGAFMLLAPVGVLTYRGFEGGKNVEIPATRCLTATEIQKIESTIFNIGRPHSFYRALQHEGMGAHFILGDSSFAQKNAENKMDAITAAIPDIKMKVTEKAYSFGLKHGQIYYDVPEDMCWYVQIT